MAHQDFDPLIIVLKVKNICCAPYQNKLKKELSKLNGVYSVDINPEKSLVSISGKVDPNSLLNTVARTGKHAEIVCFNKKSSHTKHWNKSSTSHHHHRHSCCQNQNNGEEEEEHYVPPLIDERMCRDYCRTTHRMSPIFRDSVPTCEYSGFFGHFPHHAGGPALHWPRWQPPLRPPTGYGFRWGRHWPGFDDYGYSGW